MASTGKSFDQIKAILGKLDRQVDEARTKRLGITPAPAGIPASAPAHHTPPAKAPEPEPSERRSKYGRAKPLRRSEPESKPAWTNPSPNPSRLDETIG